MLVVLLPKEVKVKLSVSYENGTKTAYFYVARNDPVKTKKLLVQETERIAASTSLTRKK